MCSLRLSKVKKGRLTCDSSPTQESCKRVNIWISRQCGHRRPQRKEQRGCEETISSPVPLSVFLISGFTQIRLDVQIYAKISYQSANWDPKTLPKNIPSIWILVTKSNTHSFSQMRPHYFVNDLKNSWGNVPLNNRIFLTCATMESSTRTSSGVMASVSQSEHTSLNDMVTLSQSQTCGTRPGYILRKNILKNANFSKFEIGLTHKNWYEGNESCRDL